MPKSFAHSLGDLAGDDIRRWRGDRPSRVAAPSRAALHLRLWRRLETLAADWRCRRVMRRSPVPCPVLVSDPSPPHAAFRRRSPT